MSREELKNMAKSGVLEAVYDLFRTNDDAFWKMFDNAVVGSLENGAYSIHMTPYSDNGKGLFLIFTGEGDDFFEVPFRSKIDDICNFFLMSTDEKAAVISDLEYALKRVKETPAEED